MGTKTIRTSPDDRFTCHSCGRCCGTMWSITVDADRVAKLRQQDWGLKRDPFIRNRGPGEEFRLRITDGRCAFLTDDNRCRIHLERRYEDKPETCKAFPLILTRVGDTTHARLSFYCPGVCAAEGKELRNQSKWLQAVRKEAGDIGRPGPLKLDDDLEISLGEANRIESQLLAWVADPAHPMARRLAAGAGLIRMLSDEAEERGKRAIGQVLEQAAQEGLEAFATRGLRDGDARRAGPVFSLFLGSDTRPTKLSRLGHFFGVRAANLGLCRLRSGTMGAKASWRKIRRVRFDPPSPDDALLTRYFTSKLASRRYLAGEATLITGFNLLVVAYGVISALARLRAAANRRDGCDATDVEAAIQSADLLVVEHANILHGALFSQLIDTLLTPTTLCASVLARLDWSPPESPRE